jgi:hypothetical protein
MKNNKIELKIKKKVITMDEDRDSSVREPSEQKSTMVNYECKDEDEESKARADTMSSNTQLGDKSAKATTSSAAALLTVEDATANTNHTSVENDSYFKIRVSQNPFQIKFITELSSEVSTAAHVCECRDAQTSSSSSASNNNKKRIYDMMNSSSNDDERHLNSSKEATSSGTFNSLSTNHCTVELDQKNSCSPSLEIQSDKPSSERDSKRQRSENSTISDALNSSSKSDIPMNVSVSESIDCVIINKKENKKFLEETDNMESDVDLSDVQLYKPSIDEQERIFSATTSDKIDNDKSNESSNASRADKKKTDRSKENAKTKSPSIMPNDPNYWPNINKTSFYKESSLNMSDILNREFGYSNRPGHGGSNHIAFMNTRTKKVSSQLQTSRHFINKAISNLDYVRKMKITQTLNFHDGCVNSLNFNRIGTLLASGSDDQQIGIWDWARNRLVLTFDSGHKSNVFQVGVYEFIM